MLKDTEFSSNPENNPFLQLLKEYHEELGLRIEKKSNTVTFLFSKIDPSNSNREFAAVITIQKGEPQLTECKPIIDPEVLLSLQDQLSLNISDFLFCTRSILLQML